jgi:hypothetical protein
VKVQKRRVIVRFFGTNLHDPRGLVTDIEATYGWQRDKQIAVDSLTLVAYAMPFIENPTVPTAAHCQFDDPAKGQIAVRQRVPLTLKHPKRGSAPRNGPL